MIPFGYKLSSGVSKKQYQCQKNHQARFRFLYFAQRVPGLREVLRSERPRGNSALKGFRNKYWGAERRKRVPTQSIGTSLRAHQFQN